MMVPAAKGKCLNHANVMDRPANVVVSISCALTSGEPHDMIWLETWGPGSNTNDKALYLMDDLGFDIHLGGRATKALHVEVLRELTESDLALLATERGVKPTHIQRITDRHHALARCLASGMSATESGLCTGYTASRISVLRGDPSFEELIAFYTTAKAETVRDFQEVAAIARNMATQLIIEKMDEAPETLSVGDALDVAKTYMDRTGHGPKQTNVNVNMNLGDRMKAAREQAASNHPDERSLGAGGALTHDRASLAPTTIDGEFSEVRDD